MAYLERGTGSQYVQVGIAILVVTSYMLAFAFVIRTGSRGRGGVLRVLVALLIPLLGAIWFFTHREEPPPARSSGVDSPR